MLLGACQYQEAGGVCGQVERFEVQDFIQYSQLHSKYLRFYKCKKPTTELHKGISLITLEQISLKTKEVTSQGNLPPTHSLYNYLLSKKEEEKKAERCEKETFGS